MTDEQIIAAIVRAEGSKFTWDKKRGDPPTKFGVTLATLTGWRGHACTPEDVQALTQDEAEAIYRSLYLPPCAKLPSPLRETQIHICVLRGTRSGIMMLQGMLAVTVDGWVGKETLGMVNRVGAIQMNVLMCGGMLQHFALEVKNKPEKEDYHAGWRDRFLRLAANT